MKTPALDEVIREYRADNGDPEVTREAYNELKDLQLKLRECVDALRAIKTGTINIPPEHSYGWWTEKKITTLEEAQKFASQILKDNSL